MPGISLADQLDSLKEKMSGLFSRENKLATDNAIPTSSGKQTPIKRIVPLVLVTALLGAGYTYQNEIMNLAFPGTPGNQPALLPVAQTIAPLPAAEAVAEMTAENFAEPATDADTFAVIEPLETTEIVNEAPLKVVSLDLGSEAIAKVELDAIDRKLLALQELEAMKNNHVEERPAETSAMKTEEEAASQTMAAHEEMIAVVDDREATIPVAMQKEAHQAEVLHATPAEASIESMRANEWTLWQSADQWAVQLMAVQTRAYLVDFISNNALENGATYFEFDRDGHHYYALVMGVYNTRTEANEAAQALSATFELQPWVRSMRSIQNAINYDFAAEEPMTLSQLVKTR